MSALHSRFLVFVLVFFHCQVLLAFQPSAQQINYLQSLSPEQQRALAQQYGLSEGFGSSPPSVNRDAAPTVSVEPRATGFVQQAAEAALGEYNQNTPRIVEAKESGSRYFGYDLFAGEPTTFEPLKDVPVSENYSIGVGDSFRVYLYGQETEVFEVRIGSDGALTVPGMEPISVLGMTFGELKDIVPKEIKKRKIGVNAIISIAELRAMRIFVLGDAYAPGSYVVSSLSTITNALLLSGGVAETGSLRNVQVKRQGKVIAAIDLYDLLLSGDNSEDVLLQSGDVVFIPPVGDRVEISGEVNRPAIYEMKAGEVLSDLLTYAGGVTPKAEKSVIAVKRYGNDNNRGFVEVPFSETSLAELRSGDVVNVSARQERLANSVILEGYFLKGGARSWFPGMTLNDLVGSVDDFQPRPDLNYGLVKRFDRNLGALEFFTVDWREVIALGSSKIEQFTLLDGDVVYAFPQVENYVSEQAADNDDEAETVHGRMSVISQLISELRQFGEASLPSREVQVTGDVRFPGVYPLTKNMTTSDLLRAAGGLTERAYKLSAEVSRSDFSLTGEKTQSRFELNLQNPNSLTFEFEPKDVLQIRSLPEWEEAEFVTLSGEVRFPGKYPIHKNDLLRDLIQRAGGLTQYAHPDAAVFTREQLRVSQQKSLNQMKNRLLDEIAKNELSRAGETSESDGFSVAQRLVTQLEDNQALGRLVIDLNKVIDFDPSYRVVLKSGDSLHVPARNSSVTVIGEVQMPVSQVYEDGLGVFDYVARSGGETMSADIDRTYVIKADGSVAQVEESQWFGGDNVIPQPGDTIVVPLDADRVNQRELWTDISQIFYQMALGAAAVSSL